MAISFTLQPPDSRTNAVEADVEYAPSQSPSPPASAMPSLRGAFARIANNRGSI